MNGMKLEVRQRADDLYDRVLLAWEVLAGSLVAEKDVQGLLTALASASWPAADAFRAVGSRPTVARIFEEFRHKVAERRVPETCLNESAVDRCLGDLPHVREAVMRRQLRKSLVVTERPVRRSIGSSRQVVRDVKREVWALRLVPVTFGSPRARQFSHGASKDPKPVHLRLLAMAFELRSGATVAALLDLGRHEEGTSLDDALSLSTPVDLRTFVGKLAEHARSAGAPVVLPSRWGVAANCYRQVADKLKNAEVEVLPLGPATCELQVLPHVESLAAKTKNWVVVPAPGSSPSQESSMSAFDEVQWRLNEKAKPRENGRGADGER